MSFSSLQNKKILITAGPTREAIDPVRYISNHSSGKMGYAIAERFLELGACVFLVSGPVSVQIKQRPGLQVIHVNSAAEMYLACCHFFEEVDVAVFAAAVADYRPEKAAEQKIKKEDDSFTIKMTRNIDIAYEFGRIKTTDQVAIGFALETNDEINHAIAKLNKKNFNRVVLNSMNDAHTGFGYDTNKISIIKDERTRKDFGLKSKKDVAVDIVDEISGILAEKAREMIEPGVYDYEHMYR